MRFQGPEAVYVIHKVIVPTYLILNQLFGVVEVHTVKSGDIDDWIDL